MAVTTTSTGNIQDFAPEFKPLAGVIGTGAEAELGRTYTPYTGIRTAGFTPGQTATQTGIMGLTTPTQFTPAEAAIAGSAGSVTAPGALTGYVNPFNVNVTDISAQQMMRDFGIEQTARDAQFAKAGAFGGSRQGISDAEAQRNLNRQLQELQFKGNAAAYQAAIDQFNKERGMQLESGTALADLGETARRTDLATMQAQTGVGQTQQDLEQQKADVAYQDFLNQRDWTKNQIGWGSGILQGTGGAGSSTTTASTATPPPNTWAQLAGAGASLYGAGNAFNWW